MDTETGQTGEGFEETLAVKDYKLGTEIPLLSYGFKLLWLQFTGEAVTNSLRQFFHSDQI